ncbi:MAG: hypothetical protein KIT79_06785 [Deltaproteobacteria bacterium]|nr:hypothetical protein [Deltaproteobacteria bacterium]
MRPRGLISWNLSELALALKIDEKDVREYFTDGRRISFLLERRLAAEVGGQLAPSEGAGFDLIDAQGHKWEVRSISKGGIYFCPSYMVGSGRAFVETGFIEKLDHIAGFLVSDIEAFPDVPYWEIPHSAVRQWWNQNQLGTTTKVTRGKALTLISDL